MNKYLIIFLRILVAAAFLFSAISKIIAPGVFEITIIDQGIVDERITASYLSRFILGLEFAIGFLFLQPYYLKKIIAPFSVILLAIFTAHLIYLQAIGDTGNCGCFGDLVKMTPLESILKNVILIAIIFVIYFKIKANASKIVLPLFITALSFALVFIIAPIKSVEDFKFSNYTHFENKGRVDLAQGDKLLAVFSLSCDHCQDAAKEMGVLQNELKTFPETYALFYNEGTVSVDSFNQITNTNFPYHMIDINVFFDLLGNSPPRVYWLKNGEIESYWDEKFAENIKASFQ